MDDSGRFIQRKPTRIPNFDYSSPNYYFITICTHEKQCIFGTPEKLSKMGEIAKLELETLPSHYDGVVLEQFSIMPNHIHAILILNGGTALDQIIGSYKSGVSRNIRKVFPDVTVWQRSFHDHVIRNQSSYEKISNYVRFNHLKWKEDCFYTET